MKYSYTTLIASLLLASSSAAIAATDTKTIELEVTKGQFVQLIGSAVDGNTKTITLNSVQAGNSTDIGTLGVNSNIAAAENETAQCTIAFSTLNNYSLNHERSGTSLRKYQLTYQSKNISSNTDQQKEVAVNCNQVPSELKFTPTGTALLDEEIQAGAYKDTVTVVVTTP